MPDPLLGAVLVLNTPIRYAGHRWRIVATRLTICNTGITTEYGLRPLLTDSGTPHVWIDATAVTRLEDTP